MLLLVTIGLVLVAAVTLVIGFVSNSLTPIYISIACSAVAALVLILFYQMNKRRGATASGGRRAPLVDTTPPVFSRGAPSPAPRRQSAKVLTGASSTSPDELEGGPDWGRQRFAEPPVAVDRPTRQFRRVPASSPPPAPAPAPAPVVAPAPAPVAAAAAPRPMVRPEPLAVAETPSGSGPAGRASMESRPAPVGAQPEPEVAPSPPAPLPPRHAPAKLPPRPAKLASPPPPPEPPEPVAAPADAWDDPAPFPIDDYDDLRVVEIINLLADLDGQELAAVGAYETAHKNRMSIISRVEALSGPAPDAATSTASLVSLPPPVAEPPSDEGVDAAEAEPPSADDLPIADYDFLGVSEILPLLAELYPDELLEVRSYEEATRGCVTVTYRIDTLLATPEPEPEPAPPAPSPVVATTAEPPAASSPVVAAPTVGVFPIAGYDKLRVFQILTALAGLDHDQLQAVRDYEEANRARVTILNQIDAQRSAPAPASAAPEPAPEAAPTPAPAAPTAPVLPPPVHARPLAAVGDSAGLAIAEYDDLTQFEIIPLLDDLFDEELEDVRDYEEANRSRSAIIYRIDALLAAEIIGEEEVDEEDAAVAAAAAAAALEAEAAAEASAAAEAAVAAEAEAPAADEEDWGELPIADYDDLTQLEIIGLLDELYDDELELMRDYEDSHRARTALLYRINALLTGVGIDEVPEIAEELEIEAIEVEPQPEAEPAPEAEPGEVVAVIDAADLPIADYDVLTVSEILPLLVELYDDELEDVRDYEEASLGRVAIVARIDALLAEPLEDEDEGDADAAEEAAEAEAEEEAYEEEAEEYEDGADEPPAADAGPAVTAAEGVGDDEPFDGEDEFEDEEEEEYEDDEAAEAAESSDASEGEDLFPIADYDELRVAEILPLLSQLQPGELDVVARHETQLANRTTILNRIARLISLTPNEG